MAGDFFEGINVLGQLPLEAAVTKLQAMGESAAADALLAANAAEPSRYGLSWWPFKNRAWQHTSHAIGHISPVDHHAQWLLPVQDASAIEPQLGLRKRRVTVTLNRLYAADYPGMGTHHVLVDVAARTQSTRAGRDIHFAATFDVRDGQAAGVLGHPIFIGLPVGSSGISLGALTVNVGNSSDHPLLSAIQSDAFKSGLKLAETWQPALGPLSELVLGVAKHVAAGARNVAVQKFAVGLAFETTPGSFCLAEGAYIAAQIPEELAPWDWAEWAFDRKRGSVINRIEPGRRCRSTM